MSDSIWTILAAGTVAIISSLVTLVVQHGLRYRERLQEKKKHPTQLVYEKQTAFAEKAIQSTFNFGYYLPIYATSAKPDIAKNEMLEKYYFKLDGELSSLTKLIEESSIYLPDSLIVKANEMIMECMVLNHVSKPEQFMHCFQTVNLFQNELKKLVGTEEISLELFEVFSTTKLKLMERMRGE